ncbi:hypothetical protein [Massilimicrobiota timonensis]|uniref:Uncharacterized protein n=1 Tax=Massilimicrobiota timonensis TaxID=1776392 RepID=A0A1Y4SWC7_9FIRM|nr:hypothetical protein [Massilimicrobiota timonensis]OUQ33242.1 hypothetical protein B5E75_10915 [Massilimicrobiota timonensis]
MLIVPENATKEEIKILEKKDIIQNLLMKVYDPLFTQFFDEDSNELLDEKIDVLNQLFNGKTPDEIEHYYDVLELYPKDGNMWD